jgi:hypothetical protein
MNLLPITHQSRCLILLAPRGIRSAPFAQVHHDGELYENILREMQRFRGHVYVSEGNLTSGELTPDGRHFQRADYNSWHLLTIDERGSVAACSRLVFPQTDARFFELLVSNCALAHSKRWGSALRAAVEEEMRSAQQEKKQFAELGGWAVIRDLRCSTEAVRMVLAGYALGQAVGGVRGISTVDVCNHSSSILRRIGGIPLRVGKTELPSFYEPQYRRDLEVLRFDSSQPNQRYADHIRHCREALESVPVIAPSPVAVRSNGQPRSWNVIPRTKDCPETKYSRNFF